jgi:hypothetical protein
MTRPVGAIGGAWHWANSVATAEQKVPRQGKVYLCLSDWAEKFEEDEHGEPEADQADDHKDEEGGAWNVSDSQAILKRLQLRYTFRAPDETFGTAAPASDAEQNEYCDSNTDAVQQALLEGADATNARSDAVALIEEWFWLIDRRGAPEGEKDTDNIAAAGGIGAAQAHFDTVAGNTGSRAADAKSATGPGRHRMPSTADTRQGGGLDQDTRVRRDHIRLHARDGDRHTARWQRVWLPRTPRVAHVQIMLAGTRVDIPHDVGL